MSPLVVPVVVRMINPMTHYIGSARAVSALDQKWDSSYVSAPALLLSDDLRLEADTGATGFNGSTRAVYPCTGKCYFSLEVGGNATNSASGGVTATSLDLTISTSYTGQGDSISWRMLGSSVYRAGTLLAATGVGTSVNRVEIAVDVDSREVWVRGAQADGASPSGWIGGGDPAAGTSPTWTIPGTGHIYPAATCSRSGATSDRYVILHPNAEATTGTPPSGYTAANWEEVE